MKKMFIVLILGLAIIKPVKVNAEPLFHKAIATAYCINGTTATGTNTIEGRTVASKREWFGATMYMWLDDGDGLIKSENFIGMYTVEDTGGENIRNGKVIDVFITDYDRAKEFGRKQVIVQIVESEG